MEPVINSVETNCKLHATLIFLTNKHPRSKTYANKDWLILSIYLPRQMEGTLNRILMGREYEVKTTFFVRLDKFHVISPHIYSGKWHFPLPACFYL